VYRVRIGPMAQRSEAEALKQQLGDTGIDAALVRIHQ
jgi:cell division septation protein DedD